MLLATWWCLVARLLNVKLYSNYKKKEKKKVKKTYSKDPRWISGRCDVVVG
jgi:hypothetical protein